VLLARLAVKRCEGLRSAGSPVEWEGGYPFLVLLVWYDPSTLGALVLVSVFVFLLVVLGALKTCFVIQTQGRAGWWTLRGISKSGGGSKARLHNTEPFNPTHLLLVDGWRLEMLFAGSRQVKLALFLDPGYEQPRTNIALLVIRDSFADTIKGDTIASTKTKVVSSGTR
jgi:hypothetical protein